MAPHSTPTHFPSGATVTFAHVPGSPLMTVRHRREFAHRSWYDVTWFDAHGQPREGTFSEDDLKPCQHHQHSPHHLAHYA